MPPGIVNPDVTPTTGDTPEPINYDDPGGTGTGLDPSMTDLPGPSPYAPPADPTQDPNYYGSPGPAYQGQVGVGGGVSNADSIFDGYAGPAIDAAKTLLKNFNAYLGWPTGFDSNQAALYVLQNNLENQPQEAYEGLYWNKLTDAQRGVTPWARYGMDADTYKQNLTASRDLLKEMTGVDVNLSMARAGTGLEGLLQGILKNGWNQKEVMDALQSGTFTDLGGSAQDLTAITQAQPWLAAGQTYQSQAQQFTTIYGSAPVDTQHLAAWYRFNRGAAQLGPWYAQKTGEQAIPGKIQAEVR